MSETRQRILIVDDEPQLTRVLLRSLTSKGYDVRIAGDGEFALQTFHDWPPSLVITDLAMPNMGGLELCRKLREVSEVPIIVLSVRGEEKTKVEALDAGADDYVTKPFGMDELLARIRAALRRKPPATGHAVVTTDAFTVDLAGKRVTTPAGEVRLTPTEWHLLEALIREPGRLVTHKQLLQQVWGPAYETETNYLRVH